MSNLNFKNVQTMIGPDVEINGPIKLTQGIIVYGRVNGDIITEGPIRISKNALVDGDIIGADIRIGGTVIGNINSNGQVVLGSSCVLKGDIVYKKLTIEDGAKFEGKCNLSSKFEELKKDFA